MVRTPKLEKMPVRKGPWSPDEDHKLITYIQRYGIWNWSQMPKPAGLLRSGKSCRLRWVNYLRPDIKRGSFSKEEEDTILKLHESMGNRWSAIAAKLPGRTDNEIKNYWHTYLKKRIKAANGSVKEAKVFTDQANSKKKFSSSETEIFLLNEAPMTPKLETTPASSCFCAPVCKSDDHKQEIAEQSVGATSETFGVGAVQSLWAQAHPQLVQDSEAIYTDPGLVTFFQEPCDSYNDYWVNLLSTR